MHSRNHITTFRRMKYLGAFSACGRGRAPSAVPRSWPWVFSIVWAAPSGARPLHFAVVAPLLTSLCLGG